MYHYRVLAGLVSVSCISVLAAGSIFAIPQALAISCAGLLVVTIAYFYQMSRPILDEEYVEHEAVNQSLQLLERAIDFEIEILSQEVTRACTLIGDGTHSMNESFQSLIAISKRQQHIIEQRCSDGHHEIAAESERLTQVINRAIQSMQFEDMTVQSLESMSDNVNQLSLISAQLRGMCNSPAPYAQQLLQLEEICKTFTKRKVPPAQHRTVSQQDLNEGEIELF